MSAAMLAASADFRTQIYINGSSNMTIYTRKSAIAEILQLQQKSNKFSTIILQSKIYKDLKFWIETEFTNLHPNINEKSFTGKILAILNPEFSLICPYGNILHYNATRKKFICISTCKCTIEKRERTSFQIYGVNNPNQSIIIKEKIKNTNFEKYGASQSPTIKVNREKTMLERYGSKYPLQVNEFKEKQENTCLEKFGVRCTFENEEIKLKVKESNIKNNGVEYPMQSPIIFEKSKSTSMKKYGFSNPAKNKEVQEKAKQTSLFNNGVEYSMQSKLVQEKAVNTNIERYNRQYSTQSHISLESLEIMNSKEKFSELLINNGVVGTARILGISQSHISKNIININLKF